VISQYKYSSLAWTFVSAYLRLNNLEISHLNARGREIRNLELDADGTLRLAASANTAHAATEATHHSAALLIVTTHTGQTELGAHEEFFATAELLDLPYDGACFGRVVHRADVGAEFRRVGVFRDGDRDLDVVGCRAALELCFCLMILSVLQGLSVESQEKTYLEHVLDSATRV
jgi:hypothetical protein